MMIDVICCLFCFHFVAGRKLFPVICQFVSDFGKEAIVRAVILRLAMFNITLSDTPVAVAAILFLATIVTVLITQPLYLMKVGGFFPYFFKILTANIAAIQRESTARAQCSVWLDVETGITCAAEAHFGQPINCAHLVFYRQWNSLV